MILGYRLRELRKNNNMSQETLGNLLGVTKVSISGYENGTRIPSMDVFISILDTFGVSGDYLMGRELNVVCEDEGCANASLSTSDIEIIRTIRSIPSLYNSIANDPKRFFNTIVNKKRI